MDLNNVKEQAKLKIINAKSQAKRQVAKQKRESTFAAPAHTNDPEIDCAEQLTAVQQGFRDRLKKEDARFVDTTDSEYWFAVCFQTRAQKEAFLKAMAWFEHGDKYLDGQFIAEQLGVELPEANNKYLTTGKIDKDFKFLSLL